MQRRSSGSSLLGRLSHDLLGATRDVDDAPKGLGGVDAYGQLGRLDEDAVKEVEELVRVVRLNMSRVEKRPRSLKR